MIGTPKDSPRVFVPPPIVVSGTLLVGLMLDGRLAGWPEITLIPGAVGAAMLGAGLFLIAAALGLFKRARTRPEPWQAASTLVRSGVYSFTRNPMYLGMVVIYLGIGIALRSGSALMLAVPLFFLLDRFVIRREEAYLRRRFGSSYDEYGARVRRWL